MNVRKMPIWHLLYFLSIALIYMRECALFAVARAGVFCSLSAEFCACYGSDIIVVSTRLG